MSELVGVWWSDDEPNPWDDPLPDDPMVPDSASVGWVWDPYLYQWMPYVLWGYGGRQRIECTWVDGVPVLQM